MHEAYIKVYTINNITKKKLKSKFPLHVDIQK